MSRRKVPEVLRKAALFTAGWASIAVGAVLAQEGPHIADGGAPEGALVFYLSDDPPPDHAAGRVLRLLELLGVHQPQEPRHLRAPTEAETELPTRAMEPLAPLRAVNATADATADVTLDAVVASHDDESATRLGDEPAHAPNAASDRTSASRLADLRNADSRSQPLALPPGMRSSRRTFQQYSSRPRVAEPPAPESAASDVAVAPASTTKLPVAPPLPFAAAPGELGLDARSATPLASAAPLAPLPPLRHGQSASQAASRESQADVTSRPEPQTNEQTPAAIAAIREHRSSDAVLEPRVTPVVKSLPAARDGLDHSLANRAVGIALARLELPPLERKLSEVNSPAVPLQQIVAAKRRPASKAAAVSPAVNTLRTASPTAIAAMPRPMLPQAPPTPSPALARSPALSPLPSPPQLQTPSPLPSPLQTPRLDLASREQQVAAAEPAPLRVGIRESRLLRTPENVVRVVPEQDGFCDVLVFNPREVAVIGKKQGTVRVELWYDQQGLNRASYLVAVDGETKSQTAEASLQKIEQLIAYLFPASRVQLVREQGRLIVRGAAVSSQQAVEIMSTVRRSQLIPVIDEIVIRPEATMNRD